MPNYQLSKIYKIYSPSKNLVYIGSTTQSLSQRLASHLRDKKNYDTDNTKHYTTSYLVLECEDYKIELLEEYACNNKQQLLKKEGEHIKNNECVNRCIAGRTRKEWHTDNADKLKEKRKQHYLTNIDKVKEYCLDNADKIKQYRIDNADKIKEQRKQFRIDNADKIKEQRKQYRIDNADKIKEQQKQYRLKKKAHNLY